MRCVIAGSRDFDDAEAFAHAIVLCGFSEQIEVVLSGACGLALKNGLRRPPYAAGADGFGERWADLRGVTLERYYADWAAHGKAAGPKRNREMARDADAALVIPDGPPRAGSGSWSMIAEAIRYDLHLWVPAQFEADVQKMRVQAAFR